MLNIIRNLKKGVNYDALDDDEKAVINELRINKIVFNSRYKAKNIYKLCDNVNMVYDKNQVTFEVFPRRLVGLFFDYDELFECKSEGKEVPQVYFLGYCQDPSNDMVENLSLGNTVKVKAIARGYDMNNEGILVRLPDSELEYFKLEGRPCITIGTAGKGKFRDTGKLIFDEEISGNKFLIGKKGLILNGEVYYNINDIKATSNVYEMNFKDNVLKKKQENKLYRR